MNRSSNSFEKAAAEVSSIKISRLSPAGTVRGSFAFILDSRCRKAKRCTKKIRAKGLLSHWDAGLLNQIPIPTTTRPWRIGSPIEDSV